MPQDQPRDQVSASARRGPRHVQFAHVNFERFMSCQIRTGRLGDRSVTSGLSEFHQDGVAIELVWPAVARRALARERREVLDTIAVTLARVAS